MKKSLCFRKCSVNPSIEYAKGLTDHQSDPSNLNQCTNQPPAYSLQSIASIRPVGRIGTCFIAVLFSTHYLVAETSIGGQDEERLEAIGYRLEAEKTDEEASVDRTASYELLTDNFNDECDEDLLNPVLMGGAANLTAVASRCLFKTGANRVVTRPFVGLGNAIEAPSREYSNDSTNQQTFSNCAYSNKPLLLSSIFHLPPIAAAVSPASMRPIGRIVSIAAAVPPTSHLSPLASFPPVNRIIKRVFSSSSSTEIREEESFGFQEISELNFKVSDTRIKASEAENAGKKILAAGYREASITLQHAIDQVQKGIQAETVGKEDESRGWYGAGRSLQSQADYQVKVSKAQENGKEALAAVYREAALISGRAAELREQEAQKKALGKIDEGVNYGVEGESLQLQADYQAKAVEEREAGREMLAEGYKEAAETSQRAAGIKHQAGEAIVAGKEYVGNSLSWVGQSFKLKAEHQAKMIESMKEGKEVLTIRLREIVETLQKASEYYQQAADIFAVANVAEAYDYYLTGEYFRLEAENQAKANEAEEAEKEVPGAVYREAALISEKGMGLGEQETEKKTLGKKEEDKICATEEECFQLKEDYRIKAIKAKEAGREILSEGYKEAVLTLERAVGQYQLAVKVKGEEQEIPKSHWGWSGDLLQAKASYQIKVSKALELGNTTLAAYYREAATTSQRAAEQHELIAQGLMEKWDGGITWRIWKIVKFLQPAQTYRVQAFEAKKEGKKILAFFYRQAALISQRIVSPCQQSYRVFYEKKWYEREIRSDIANSLKTKADYEVKAAKAYEEAKRFLAASYQRAAATYQRAADLYELVLKNEGAGIYSRSNKWYEVGNLLQLKADYHVKACEAEEVGKTIFATNYREAVVTLQHAIDNFTRFSSGQYNEIPSWRSAAGALQIKANYQVKAIEAEKAGKAILAEKYREAIIILQRSADQYMQAAEAYAAKDMHEGNRLSNEAQTSRYEGIRASSQDKIK